MLIKSRIWNVLLTWMQIPKMKHFRSIAGEKMKAKIGIYECYFGKLIIWRDGSLCWQNCYNFHNQTHDIALWVSRKLGWIIAKFAYILLSQIKYDCFDLS